MTDLSLIEAFSKFGAKPPNRLGSLSALATDGAMVLTCQLAHFSHPTHGVLRYETRLSATQAGAGVVKALGEHLMLARDGDLPVRMVVTSDKQQKSGKSRRYYVRSDLIGKVAEFDGDRFVVDFTRQQPGAPATTALRRK